MATEVHQSKAPGQRVARRHASILEAVILILLLFSTGGVLTSQVRAQAIDEYQVKAAFLYNFVKFVEWPADAFPNDGAPIIIGLVGNDPFGSKIDQMINGRFANGRRLVLKRFPDLRTLAYCHIVFICSSEKNNLRQLLSATGAGVLTVSETDRFTQMGGMINFTIVDSKVRFEINQGAAERAGLKISAKLLSLGRPARN